MEMMDRIETAERIGHEIMSIRSQIISLDGQRNKNREAIRALNRIHDQKMWLMTGNLFVKTPVTTAKSLIDQDQKDVEKTINELQNLLKDKTDQLKRLEGCEPVPSLKPLSRQELRSLSGVLPETTSVELK